METGCYIDGSHISSIDFSRRVIDLAVEQGFEIDTDMYNEDMRSLDEDSLDEDLLFIVLEGLDYTYCEAIDFLNETAPDNLIWTVEDQSLFLEEADD